jgi:predicted  nucleic acid-binding Zn-ribbon protein
MHWSALHKHQSVTWLTRRRERKTWDLPKTALPMPVGRRSAPGTSARRAKIEGVLMLSDLKNLMELQVADREIKRLRDEVAALPKRVAAIENKLAATKAELEKAKAAVKGDEAAKKKFETSIQDLQGKISKYRDQSLDVKTNDQYKALMHEIEFAQQEIRANEDRVLEVMMNAEGREKQVKAAEAELKAETAEIEREKASARDKTAEDEKLLGEWNAKRTGLLGGVDADLLRHYERVAKFRGSGISEVLDQKCSACQVMLRPQTYNEVRTDKLVICESCQRILFFDPAKEKPVEKAPQVATRKHRARPKVDAAQAWFFHPGFGEAGEVLLAYINEDGRSRRRVFEFETGRQVGDTLEREGNYRLAFPEDLSGVLRLNGSWDEEEIDSWGEEMPSVVLERLHRDLSAARSESSQTAAQHLETPSEQAAS